MPLLMPQWNKIMADADLTITRFCYADTGTFGMMTVSGYHLYTVEQPWNGNKQGASCIPEGDYTCKPAYYHRGGYKAIEIFGNNPEWIKDGRSKILIHKANWPHQLRGCIAPVSDWGCVSDMVGGPDSGNAFKIVMDAFGSNDFLLRIQRISLPDMEKYLDAN
jgi:hypothetical protein